jgi:hypothetical protein
MDQLITMMVGFVEIAAIVTAVWALIRISRAFGQISRSLAEIAGSLRKP